MPDQYSVSPSAQDTPATINPSEILVSVLSEGKNTTVWKDDKARLAVSSLETLATIAEWIRECTDLETQTAELRKVLDKDGREGAYKKEKLGMPAIIPAALAPEGHPRPRLAASGVP